MIYVNDRAFFGFNGPLCRAIGNAFGHFIVPGHLVDPDAIMGREKVVAVDDCQLIAGLL